MRCTHRFCTGLIGFQIISQHLTHSGYISAASAQKGCCLKGSHSCTGGKIIGIDHNTCVQTICLHTADTQIIWKILQNLSHHLTGRRCIRLYIRKHSIFNHLAAPSVMIQHNYCFCHIQQILTFCIAWFIGIHHYYNCIIIYQIPGLITGYKHRWLIFWIIHISHHKRPYGCGRIIYNNIYSLSKSLTCTINTNSCTQGIHICDLVSHNNHTILSTHKFLQCLCFYPRFHPGGFLHLLSLTAIISNIVSVFDHYLISAASQSHLNGNSGILIILNIISRVQSDTNTEGNRHFISNINSLNLIQNMESLFF